MNASAARALSVMVAKNTALAKNVSTMLTVSLTRALNVDGATNAAMLPTAVSLIWGAKAACAATAYVPTALSATETGYAVVALFASDAAACAEMLVVKPTPAWVESEAVAVSGVETPNTALASTLSEPVTVSVTTPKKSTRAAAESEAVRVSAYVTGNTAAADSVEDTVRVSAAVAPKVEAATCAVSEAPTVSD
jgi:hypothetical protein